MQMLLLAVIKVTVILKWWRESIPTSSSRFQVKSWISRHSVAFYAVYQASILKPKFIQNLFHKTKQLSLLIFFLTLLEPEN